MTRAAALAAATFFLFQAALAPQAPASGRLRLHPDNPHYFLWRGEPTVIVTSGEHYGALLNLDFDYRRYLDTLHRDRLNGTRVFVGSYVEGDEAFNIAGNTLNPARGRFIAPWARSAEPGYADGGNKFDLTRWNEAYFRRLRDLVTYAGQRDVIVEMNLFSPMYEEGMWALSPLNAANNVNGVGRIGKDDVFTLDRHGGTLPFQEAMVRRIVSELRPYDNVYIEVCNEPYARQLSDAWHRHITDVIAEAMRGWDAPILISQNVANQAAKIVDPHPAISIFNFHYATPPSAVDMNYHLNRPIGDNETGFRGTGDDVYRMEAWEFMLAGGALFNHLDYSFTADHEDGTFEFPPTQPGGGGPTIRKQLAVLKQFIESFDFVRMAPDTATLRGGGPPLGSVRVLSEPGRAYAVYVRDLASTGPWSARWTGTIQAPEAGEYTLHTISNDGVRLWIGDRLVIDNWTDHGEQEDTAVVRLEPNAPQPIRLEYFYAGGQGVIRLLWSREGSARTTVPSSALSHEGGPGLRGQYYQGTSFDSEWFSRVDSEVDFALGTEPPRPPSDPADGSSQLDLDVPAGTWRTEWIDPRSGQITRRESIDHTGGVLRLAIPDYEDDIALRIVRETSAGAPVARLREGNR